MKNEPTSDALSATGSFEKLLDDARAGSAAALGRLIEECRHYLLSIANQELPASVRAKMAPSDVVQDSCMEAQLSFQQFRGQCREELVSWLRAILIFNISNTRRRYCSTGKRQLDRELSLDNPTEQGNAAWQIATDDPTPSQVAIQREEEARVTAAIEQLPDHFRQVVLFRHRERLSFTEIGKRVNRSAEATRKLWARGIEQLQQILAGESEPADE